MRTSSLCTGMCVCVREKGPPGSDDSEAKDDSSLALGLSHRSAARVIRSFSMDAALSAHTKV